MLELISNTIPAAWQWLSKMLQTDTVAAVIIGSSLNILGFIIINSLNCRKEQRIAAEERSNIRSLIFSEISLNLKNLDLFCNKIIDWEKRTIFSEFLEQPLQKSFKKTGNYRDILAKKIKEIPPVSSHEEKKFLCLLKSHLDTENEDINGFRRKYFECERAQLGVSGALGNNVDDARYSIDTYYRCILKDKGEDLGEDKIDYLRHQIFLSNTRVFQDEFPKFALTVIPSLHQDIYEAYIHKIHSAFNSIECQFIVDFFNKLRKINESFEGFKPRYTTHIELVPFYDALALVKEGNQICQANKKKLFKFKI